MNKNISEQVRHFRKPWKLFRPILAGATLRERLLACLGSVLGIGLTGIICALAMGKDAHLPLLVAPMGASAVLLFAVPTSPLAQPWPTIGGNVISAFVGLTVAHFVPDPVLAAGLAVGLAIAVMSFLRCLHPPGGAAALVAAFGGPAVASSGFLFPLFPVGINAVLLVGLGWTFHKLCRRSYPHVPAVAPVNTHATGDVPAIRRIGFRPEDIDDALEKMGETFDISREDLDRLLLEVERRALVRSHAGLTAADIMSRDVIAVDRMADPNAARSHLLTHDIRMLPVIDGERRVLGYVGFRQLLKPASRVSGMMEKPVTARPDTPAMELVGMIADGTARAVIIVDDQQHLLGLVTQTDLLAALSSGLAVDRQAA
jgi:CBS domain-containing membrane protein